MDQRDTIYGVKLDDDITPIDVRNAIIQCYYEADLKVLEKLFQQSDFESIQDEKETKYKHVQLFIKKIFDEVQADFNNPSKESLIEVINKCKDLAKMFRSEELIEQHYKEIMILISKLDPS